ncbi:pyrimidine reductase family protein [Nocardia huaxiensis]|uniref:Pyrimidine reductase family protein n=1 Tax=Nocardia huaxiensis TaxID=2755382 RepID=A0A7D6VC90_9NOCA|nr:pyrimidine reductase family protein [Nocardia huaxiensis]QLY29337.1 pyrimidine reductase family protein [Nocardia huaxiensis]UFS97185.1 pyrimidine reductase family protein [Nocardia huaxiensis]
MQRMPNATHLTALSHDDLVRMYAYPVAPVRPWIRVNFVTSIDGAVTVDGRSGGLGTPADKTVFRILRDLADVVVVGAGTVRAENYGAAHTDSQLRTRLYHHGFGGDPDGAAPRIAVVSGSAALDPTSRLFTDTGAHPLVITTADAPADRKRALADAGAEVVEAGETSVTPAALSGVLAERRMRRVLCEGGPSLFGDLIAAEAVDELCLTVSPLLVAGSEGRISVSPNTVPTPMSCRHLLFDDDGTILTRWERTHTH